MNPQRDQRIQAILQGALRHDAAERTDFLDEACAGDDSLRREVESLLRAPEQPRGPQESTTVEHDSLLGREFQPAANSGGTVGPYRILSRLGAGGMGEVYLAEDTRLGRRIALKLLPLSLTSDEKRVLRFRQEAAAAAALNHPNLLTIHEVGQADAVHFIATEYVEGQTLRAGLDTSTMSIDELVDTGVQVASALAAAHTAGVVHRDIKPENIMLRRDGYLKVLDFGLAKLTEPMAGQTAADSEGITRILMMTNPGLIMGTVSYMSHEQARGLDTDVRTDVWSLGVVLYEMLTGRLPFTGPSSSHVIVAIQDQAPNPIPERPEEFFSDLGRIIRKALAKDRAERYQSGQEILVDLQSLQKGLQSIGNLPASAPG